jgi:hypothetical protein
MNLCTLSVDSMEVFKFSMVLCDFNKFCSSSGVSGLGIGAAPRIALRPRDLSN